MNRILMLGCIVFIGLNFSGCDDEEIKSVDFYLANKQIAKDRFQECRKMEKRSKKIQKDCENASLAYGKVLN